jgi:putative heme-binding domain-containing protein
MRLSRFTLLGGLLAISLAGFGGRDAEAQKAKAPPKPVGKTAEELLKPTARPKKPELPTSALPLQLVKGERIAFVGNSTAERMNLFGNFETMLHIRFPDKELVVRNFARPADEVGNRQRPSDYTRLDDPLYSFNPDTMLCFFGFNESMAGKDGVAKFEADYEKFLDEYAKKYPRDDAGSPPRFVIVSPIAFEPSGDPLMPDGEKVNENLKLYAAAAKAVAEKRKIAFIDVLKKTEAAFTKEKGLQFTINGAHTNDAGDKLLATALRSALFGDLQERAFEDTVKYEKLRAAVNDKSWVHLQDYRMLNGWYVYGGRRTFDTETFPREYVKIRAMVEVRDRYVWDIAQSKEVAAKPDDSKTGELIVPPTRFGQVQKSEDPRGPNILTPNETIKSCTVPEGFEIKLFADEKRFPEIGKPVQMTFDAKGRLWVSTMPSYPLWKPGDPKPMDKLLILEDLDGDGVADKCTVFYDKLHCPTGFEFCNGGVLVVDQPRLIFLKDTDGDDKADEVVQLIDGWATEDTHHTINAFEMSPSGRLHMLEGVSMSTAVETPWGPFRNFGSSGGYVLDPRTLKVSHFNTPGYGNPWCYVFDEWGHGFCGDGTGANQHWDTPLSGAQFQGRKSYPAVFDTEQMRPVVGSDFLVSRHFPDDVQKQFIYACVINMNGMPRWTFEDDGGGFKGTRVRFNPNDKKTPNDLIKSTDKHFRPVDPQIGPDGALWFGDWANPLIGHMQYSQRDPNRDHVHGRIYRLVNTKKPLLKPVTQFGKTNTEVLNQLNEYEWRTRYRARRELQNRPEAEVLAAVKDWTAKLDPSAKEYDRLRCEALWIQSSFHKVDAALLGEVLKAKTPDARAAAVRIAADEREYLPNAADLLKAAANDEHPRVRVEACRGLSYFPTGDAAGAVLVALSKKPTDSHVQYTGEAALAANIKSWQAAYIKGEIAKSPEEKKLIEGLLATDKKGAALIPYLQILLGKDQKSPEERNKAMSFLSEVKGGNPEAGKLVFRANCIACHKVFGEGQDYGPEMDKGDKGPVGKRLTRFKLVESIIDPNADVEEKYLSTRIDTVDGKVVIGLKIGEDKAKKTITIFDGKEKKTVNTDDIDKLTTLKQSSMPEGLAGTISPVEFLDLIAFLASLNK